MPEFEFEGKRPRVDPTAWVAPTATLIGDVTIEAGASVWYNVVIRADLGPIIVRAGANVQDGCVLHGGPDPVTEVGANATLGHLCVVHGCVIGEQALIGNGATVQDGAVVGARALVAAGALVPPGARVPDGHTFMGAAAKDRGELTESGTAWVEHNAEIYQQLAARHRDGTRPLTGLQE